jgi:alkyldihydroxyacetonephosphate synthase
MTDLRWHGWGYADKTYSFGHRPDALDFLRVALELRGDEAFPACDLDAIRLRAPRLTSAQLSALRHIVPETKTDTRTRILHAYGKAYPDLIRLRRGEIPHPPDAVAYPATEDQVTRVIAFCAHAHADFALIPFGGGTSAVGGVEPRDARVTITLDLARLNRVLTLDEVSQTATIETGILGPDLERELNARGFTLGHLPQSFEFSTLGGWIATCGAGLASTKYGKIEALTQGIRVATPRGIVETRAVPATRLLQLLVGSEGTLGVITRATMRVHRLPKKRDYGALLFKNMSAGIAALRMMLQNGTIPATVCLSDEDATRTFRAFAPREQARGWQAVAEQIGESFIAARGYSFDQGALMILGFEDDASGARAGQAICKSHGALGLRRGVADAWLRDWYETPYRRDALLDRGILVDTLETATTWSNLERLHKIVLETIKQAAAETGARALVMTQISHACRDGASLDVTYLARMARAAEGQGAAAPLLAQWEAIKRAAIECIIANRGTVSRHHGIGHAHAAWMDREVGATPALAVTAGASVGLDALRAAKNALDPNNVMNPGKWLAPEPRLADIAIEHQERFWNLPSKGTADI